MPNLCFGIYPLYNNNNYQPINFSNNNGRITGKVPNFSNKAVTNVYQYYKPEYYDRLADSGIYIGFGIGYVVSTMGGVNIDYAEKEQAFSIPGSFNKANFYSDKIFPVQIMLGTSVNSNLRIDFSYLRLRGLSYPKNVDTFNGVGYTKAKASGGNITTNTTMINAYYNVESYTGYLAGGNLVPYVGVGLGIALNTIADYVVYDGTFYVERDPAGVPVNTLTAISDIYAYHNGGTMEQFAYMLEIGATNSLGDGIKVDFFVRYDGFNLVKSSGSTVVSQTEWISDGNGGEQKAPYESVFHYTDCTEGGNLSTLSVGVKLRMQF